MNITHKLSRKQLLTNKRSTLFSVCSIALAVSLSAMIMTLMFGLIEGVKESILMTTRAENVHINETDAANVPLILDTIGSENIKQSSLEEHGNIMYDHDDNPVYLMGVNIETYDSFSTNDPITQLSEGRLPENDHEVVLSRKYNRDTSFSLNETYRVDVREGGKETQMTVVGFTTNNSYISYYQLEQGDIVSLYIQLNDSVTDIKPILSSLNKLPFDVTALPNNERNYALGIDDFVPTLIGIIYGAATFLIIFLAIATFSLIFNSFNATIDQHVKDYGLMRSVGATQKQISSMILTQGFTLSSIGIALGTILGYGFATLVCLYINQRIAYSNTHLDAEIIFAMHPHLPWFGIAIVVVFSLIMVAIPLVMAIRKLFKRTSFEALRSPNKERKVKHLKPKYTTLSLAQNHLYYQRSRYRSIQFSLIIAITLFIGIMSFSEYIFATNSIFKTIPYNIEIYSVTNDTKDSVVAILENHNDDISFRSSQREVRGVYLLDENNTQFPLNSKLQFITNRLDKKGQRFMDYGLIILDDQTFQDIATDSGLKLDNKTQSAFLMNAFDGNVVGNTKEASYQGNILDIGGDRPVKLALMNFDNSVDAQVFYPQTEFQIVKVFNEHPASIVLPQYDSPTPTLVIAESQAGAVDQMRTAAEDIGNYMLHYSEPSMYVLTEDANKLAKAFQSNDETGLTYRINNVDIQRHQSLFTKDTISQVVYGFITFITLTALFNILAVTANILLKRQQEFAALRSIGMTPKSLRLMLIIESTLLIIKPLIIGTLIGVLGMNGYMAFLHSDRYIRTFSFYFDIKTVLIAWSFGLFIILIHAALAINNAKKHSIIEALRGN